MLLAIRMAAAGWRAGVSGASRDFNAFAFAGLGNLAPINVASKTDLRVTMCRLNRETSTPIINIEYYIVNNFVFR